jgi:hypothetical protein
LHRATFIKENEIRIEPNIRYGVLLFVLIRY